MNQSAGHATISPLEQARALAGDRPDIEAIAAWVKQDSTVLDLGCGDGLLLRYLKQARNARGYGVEISDERIIACVRNGVNVIQMNLEAGLQGFDAASFDCVILSQTLQAMRHTGEIVLDMLRVGREAIVSFPNFGRWDRRAQVLFRGRMPVSEDLPYQWYDTPNLHLCTLADFESFCTEQGIEVMARLVLHSGRPVTLWPNLFGSLAAYHIRKQR